MDKITTGINEYLLTKIIGHSENRINQPEDRKKTAYLEAWISIIGNLILAAVKVLFGLIANSISLLADAAHTASDVITSVVVLLGFKLSSLPPDSEHPHGHGRIEFIASLVIAILLIIVGIEFGFASYNRYIDNTAVKGTYFVAVFMIVAALIKELMSRISIDLGNRINSSTLIADAWHHRTDAIASVLVAIAIMASKYGYYRADAVLGFVVSALIIYTGYEIFREASSKLIGESCEEDINEINRIALTIPGVRSTHDISLHDYGANKAIAIHIEIEENISREQAHYIAHQVEEKINSSMYARTTVHVDAVKNNPLATLE